MTAENQQPQQQEQSPALPALPLTRAKLEAEQLIERLRRPQPVADDSEGGTLDG